MFKNKLLTIIKFSKISLKKKNEYAIVKLNRGRANPINHEMVNELRTVINRIEKDENLKGIILTGQPNFFSVGLDVIELYELNENQIKIFFKDLGDLFRTYYISKNPYYRYKWLCTCWRNITCYY